MRLAYLSPLPPLATGIADHSAELLPHLAERFGVEVFAEGSWTAQGPAGLPVSPLRDYAARAADFDLALYHVGNHPAFHSEIYRAALAHPGVAVLHEVMLHHLVREATVAAEGKAGFVEVMRSAYGRGGEAAARRFLDQGYTGQLWSYPLFEPAVDASRGVVVHNRAAERRILASRPEARVGVVPLLVELGKAPDPEAAKAALLAELGLGPDTVLIGCFGLMTAQKRLEVILRAFARLHAELPHTHLLLAGEIARDYDLESILGAEAGRGVLALGRREMAPFERAMAAVDVAVNLRHPSGGETSATLVRLFLLGRAAIVSRTGSFAELPDDCCAKVGLDGDEEELLLAYLRRFAGDEALRRRMGENARRWATEEHSAENVTKAYASFLEEVASTPYERPKPAPPIAPYPPSDLLSPLAGSLGAELVDLGLGDDRALAGLLAECLVDLDLDVDLDRPGPDPGLGPRGASPV